MTLKNKKVLITSGPTWVPIDEVRVISNRSSGKMGRFLTEEFAKAGARITLLEGPGTKAVKLRATVKKFHFYAELDRLLQSELKKKFDIIVHAAAVSDYRLRNIYRGKLPSGLSKIDLILVPTPKLINKIRKLAPTATLVGFKLEPTNALSALRKKGLGLVRQAGCDLVVANGLNGNQYRGCVIDRNGQLLGSASSREGVAKQLVNVLKDDLR